MGPSLERSPFGAMPDGTPVELFTFRNAQGTGLRAMTYGAAIVSLSVPDRDGSPADVVLGFDSLSGYLSHSSYFGAIVGRYANRIRNGRFTLDGRTHRLALNDGPNHLHGGIRGFDKVVWRAEPFRSDRGQGLLLRHSSPDGDEGYPGTLTVEVRYLLTDADELVVDYEAATDAPTPVNLTQHCFFNLAGKGDILGHQLMLAADAFTPVGATLIPTGEIAPVADTPLDFRTPVAIGARIASADPQLRHAGGYDHNFVLRRIGPGPVHAARVVEPTTGRTLDVSTTEPGLRFYSGNFLDGTLTGKGGRRYGPRAGFCLETQHFPDSPNQPRFPSTILRPGERYRSRTVFAFGIQTRVIDSTSTP
ncbi:MAG TPA: aldose epimerase family protein [Gemmatimonadales bacterium]